MESIKVELKNTGTCESLHYSHRDFADIAARSVFISRNGYHNRLPDKLYYNKFIICLVGNNRFTKEQRESLHKLLLYIRENYYLDLDNIMIKKGSSLDMNLNRLRAELLFKENQYEEDIELGLRLPKK